MINRARCIYFLMHLGIFVASTKNNLSDKTNVSPRFYPLRHLQPIEGEFPGIVMWRQVISPKGFTWILNDNAPVPIQLTFPPNAVNQPVIFNCYIENKDGLLPEIDIYVGYGNCTELDCFHKYVELRFLNVSPSVDKRIRINGELMTAGLIMDTSTLVVSTQQFPYHKFFCCNVSVHVKVYYKPSPNGLDVHLYFATNKQRYCEADGADTFLLYETFRIKDLPDQLFWNMKINIHISQVAYSWKSYFEPASIQVRNGILCKCKHCCDKLPEATGMHFERDQFSLSTVLRFKLSVGFEGHKFTFKYIQGSYGSISTSQVEMGNRGNIQYGGFLRGQDPQPNTSERTNSVPKQDRISCAAPAERIREMIPPWIEKKRPLEQNDMTIIETSITNVTDLRKLGSRLGIDCADIDRAHTTHGGNIAEVAYRVLNDWYKRWQDKTEAFVVICDALNSVDRGSVVTKMLLETQTKNDSFQM